MPDLNHKFHAGKMNKDLDERLVPNGEYRDALNVQMATSDGSDVGSLQNLLGNLDISSKFFINQKGEPIDNATLETYGFYCVGSATDDKNDRLYWLVSGMGIDFIAEYDYKTKIVSPIVVDIFQTNLPPGESGRVLNFDKSFLITGINIIEDKLFWTDNNTEPKRINIPEIRIGTSDFLTHTQFYVPNPNKDAASISTPFVSVGNLKHEHITVIRKGPSKPPTLEMKNTTREDISGSGSIIGEVTTTLSESSAMDWFNQDEGNFHTTPFPVTFDTAPDFKENDKLIIESVQPTTGLLKKTKLIAQIVSQILPSSYSGGQLSCSIKILSYDKNIDLSDASFDVRLLQDTPLFEFKFPRFGCRYKYKDGEYSAFSPFSEVAFLPGSFDYLPKEGYNLAMVNTIRELGVCNFVDERYIPDDVISIDILYKESNSPNIYSIKSVKRVVADQGSPVIYDSWNAISPTKLRDQTLILKQKTYGYVDIEAEMIHSILPSNQLLRGWDNVPRQALAQEVIGNRLVYANYLQNYNMSSSAMQRPSALYTIELDSSGNNVIQSQDVVLKRSKNINIDVKLSYRSEDVGSIIPEQLDAGKAYTYKSPKTIKSLRTYQVGVVYIDEFGRETPVFSDSKTNSNTTYVEKTSAHKQTKLHAHIGSPKPDFAKNFKFLIKETSSEYYNIAMDRWYPAEDGNLWLSFPSSDRNKVDLETFLILKKRHDSPEPVKDLAKYKILDIDNEVPTFVKTKRVPVRTVTDGFVDAANTVPILMQRGVTDPNWPYINGTFVEIHDDIFGGQAGIWDTENDSTNKQFRFVSSEGASDWYDVKSWENNNVPPVGGGARGGYWKIISGKKFGVDMSTTTTFNAPISTTEPAYGNIKIEFVKKEEKVLPEFEGRFFVKILKDAYLQEHIIGYEGISSTYTSISQIQCQYINPFDSEVQTGASLDDPGNFYNCDPAKISVDNDNEDTGKFPTIPVSQGGIASGNGHGHYFWQAAGDTEHASSASSGWFIDKIEAFRPFAYNAYYFDRSDEHGPDGIPCSYSSLPPKAPYHDGNHGDDLSTMGSTWENFATWQSNPGNHYFHPKESSGGFYDTAQSWSTGWFYGYAGVLGNPFMDAHGIAPLSFGDYAAKAGKPFTQLQLIGDCTNHISNLEGGSLSGYLGSIDIATPVNPATGKSVLREAVDIATGSWNQNGRILPAVGVDQLYDIISLSYAGMGKAKNYSDTRWPNSFTDSDGEDNLKSYFTHSAWGNDYVIQQTFIDAVTTPGTIWRWKEDPSQVVYQTQQLNTADGHGTDSNISAAEWSYNEVDRADWATPARGVELYNYTRIQDYVTYHYLERQKDAITNSYCYAPRANWATQAIGNYAALEGTLSSCMSSTNVPTYGIEAAIFPLMNSPLSGGANRWPMFTADWDSASNRRRRYTIHAKVLPNQDIENGAPTTGGEGIGGVAPHYYSPTNNSSNPAHFDHTGTVLTTVPNTIAPGIRPDGMYSGREMVPTNGTYFTLNSETYTKIPGLKMTDGTLESEPPGSVTWQILSSYAEDGADEGYFSQNPGVWETEPKENLGLEIYHEVGQIYPTELNESNVEQFFGPVYQGVSTVDPSYLSKNSSVTCWTPPPITLTPSGAMRNLSTNSGIGSTDIRVENVQVIGDKVYVWLRDINGNKLKSIGFPIPTAPKVGDRLMFTRADGSRTEVNVKSIPSQLSNIYEVYIDVHNYEVTLPWFNAYSFGNGVESNRIRDDYNQITIDKGPKVSAVLEEPYAEEHRPSGFIYSGIYNSMSGINNLNQFIQAEKITKDLNPSYGSIQKLFARNTNLVTFCEDKVFKILANKDALYNADGSVNLIATENVLGQTTPFSGDYGISTNPESFAADAYRLYFSDRARGSVLRLSQDGVTPISSYGMTDWFADNLPNSNRIIGSFDENKKEYNISLSYYDYTVYPVKILGSMQQSGPSLPGQQSSSSPVPSATLEVKSWIASKFEIGDDIVGPGIPIGATVFAKNNQGAGVWTISISQPSTTQDVSTLGDYICGDIDCLDLWWNTRLLSSTEPTNEKTLSYSDIVKGWPSFKSFHHENGLSLNNDYFTIKGGQLYQHHINQLHNNFYSEQYDSSVEVLFNEEPGSVKSFQTLDYEGTQSKITSDGGLSETSNSGEYWDNYDKLGWYVDNMYTNLQEVEPEEFKNKEGKWFSTVKGVATEWLDDGKAGNIDTREFSYQGIDEASAITVLPGSGYTSWDCQLIADVYTCVEVQDLKGAYPDEASCLADPDSECNPTCNTSNVVTVHTTDAWTAGCNNGKVSVEVYLAGNATSWTVEYFHIDGTSLATSGYVIDPNVYTQNGYSQQLNIQEQQYYVVVTDDLGCTVQKNFTIDCTLIQQPCPSTNPHTFAGHQIQNPQLIAGDGDCYTANTNSPLAYSGSITLTNISLAGTTTGWAYALFELTSGISTLVDNSSMMAAGMAVTIQGLEQGDYEIVLEDSEGCIYPESFTLTCPSSSCDPPILGQSSTSITKSTSTDGCVTDNSDGTHTLLNVIYPGGTGSYYVAYYEYDNSLYSSFPGLTLATQIQAPTGPFTSTSPSPVASISNLSDSSISGKDYAVVIATDASFSCISVNEFIMKCVSLDTPLCNYIGGPPTNQNHPPIVSHIIQPATSNDCPAVVYSTAPTIGTNNDGQISFSSIVCQPTATSFTIEIIYGNATSGFTSVYNSGQILTTVPQPILGPGNLWSTSSVAAANTPPYNTSIYVAVVTDNIGCERRITFQVPCYQSVVNPNIDPAYECDGQGNCNTVYVAPNNITIFGSLTACQNHCTPQPLTYECVNLPNVGGGFTSSCQTLYDGSGTYSSLAACQAACDNSTAGVLNWKCTSYGNICQPTADPVNYVDVFDDEFDCNISCGLTVGPNV